MSFSEKSKSYFDTLKGLKSSSTETEIQALQYFEEHGLPTKRAEDYKYNNFEKEICTELRFSSIDHLGAKDKETLASLPGDYKAVFINGQFSEKESQLPDGVTLKETAQPLLSPISDPFEAISYQASQKSYTFTFTKNTKSPLISLANFHLANELETTSSLINLNIEAGAQAEVLEFHASHGDHRNQTFTVTNLSLGENAHLKFASASLGGLSQTGVYKVKATLAKNANLNNLTFSVSGALVRNNIEIYLNGEGSHATANGLYTARGEQHQDNFSHIHHAAPHSTSNQIFKGIIDDSGRGAFTGKIVVHRDAQKVDSSQLNKNLLLSKKAQVDTRPQIEVYADDVKCGHGATVGQINQEEVFYLESRGIPRHKAQKILCHAFGQEVLDSFEQKEVSTFLSELLYSNFEKFALENLELGDD